MVHDDWGQGAEARGERGEVVGGVLHGFGEVRFEAFLRDGLAQLAQRWDRAVVVTPVGPRPSVGAEMA